MNGDKNLTIAIPGLMVDSISDLKQTICQFRSLQPGEEMAFGRIANTCKIHCVSLNCYAVEVNDAPVWHLFNQETLDSLLITAHPLRVCAPGDVELGRRLLMRSLQLAVATKS